MIFGIAQYRSVQDEDGWQYFAPPAGCVGSIDLTPPAAADEAIWGTRYGRVLCVFDVLPDDDTFVPVSAGDPRDGRPGGKTLDTVDSLIGYRPKGDTWARCIEDILTAGADPLGNSGPRPLMPQQNLLLPVWLAGRKISERKFDVATDPHADQVLTMLRAELSQARKDSLAGRMINPITQQADATYFRQLNDSRIEQFVGRDPAKKQALYDVLFPTRDPADKLIAHNTSIADDFNRGNSTGLGTATVGGASQGWSWSANGGTGANIVSQAAVPQSSSDRERAEVDLSTNNNYSQIERVAGIGGSVVDAPLARMNAANLACYQFNVLTAASLTYRLFSVNSGGTALQIASVNDTAPGVPHTSRLECDGSTIRGFVDGVQRVTVSNMTVGSGTRCGFTATAGVTTLDNFQAGDIVASTPVSQSTGTSYESRQALSATRQSGFESLQRLSLSRVSAYESRVALAALQAAAWESLGSSTSVGQVQPTSWESRAPVSADRVISWEMIAPVAAARGVSWDSLQAVLQSGQSGWEAIDGGIRPQARLARVRVVPRFLASVNVGPTLKGSVKVQP